MVVGRASLCCETVAAMIEWLFNHCKHCGKRIPWRARAFFGNTYKPGRCMDCVHRSDVKIFGSTRAANAALLAAAAKEVAEHGWPR